MPASEMASPAAIGRTSHRPSSRTCRTGSLSRTVSGWAYNGKRSPSFAKPRSTTPRHLVWSEWAWVMTMPRSRRTSKPASALRAMKSRLHKPQSMPESPPPWRNPPLWQRCPCCRWPVCATSAVPRPLLSAASHSSRSRDRTCAEIHDPTLLFRDPGGVSVMDILAAATRARTETQQNSPCPCPHAKTKRRGVLMENRVILFLVDTIQ